MLRTVVILVEANIVAYVEKNQIQHLVIGMVVGIALISTLFTLSLHESLAWPK
ncbi:MAG: hypothetical protein WA364_07860 [Candidatus Nitrosopolaris sp.]